MTTGLQSGDVTEQERAALMDADADISRAELSPLRHLAKAPLEPRVCPLCGTLAFQARGLRRPGFFDAPTDDNGLTTPPLHLQWRCRRCGF
ncbi:MAG: hypothetical protein ACRDIB_15675, partial [Ardenticatenaceae bacterium]